MGASRPDGHAEMRRDFWMGPAVEIVEQKHLPPDIRERSERGREVRSGVRPLRRAERTGVARRDGFGVAPDSRLDRVQRLGGADPLPAPEIERPVPRNREQPGPEFLFRPAALELLQRGHERVLADVVRVARVEPDRERRGVRGPKMAAHELAERVPVAGTRLPHEGGIVGRTRRLMCRRRADSHRKTMRQPSSSAMSNVAV